jgi:multidrug transporter EmrE-like cation transporter
MRFFDRSGKRPSVSLILSLSLGSAACYVLATLVMKRWDAIGGVPAALLVAAVLSGAVLLETEALRQARLGFVLIVILGFEASLALLCGWLLLRESYSLLGILGLLLIIAGVAIIHLAPAAADEATRQPPGAAPGEWATASDGSGRRAPAGPGRSSKGATFTKAKVSMASPRRVMICKAHNESRSSALNRSAGGSAQGHVETRVQAAGTSAIRLDPASSLLVDRRRPARNHTGPSGS